MPRPIEIKFQVSLFVRGGDTPGMDAPLKLAGDFHDWLDSNLVQNGEEFARRPVLAVEVTPVLEEEKT